MRLVCWRRVKVYAKDGDDEIESKVNVGENITARLCAECGAV